MGAALPNYSVTATNGTLTINDIVISVSRPRRPARGATGSSAHRTGATRLSFFQVSGLAPGQAVNVGVACAATLVCSAPVQVVADASPAPSATFAVSVRSSRSLRLLRGAADRLADKLRVAIQAGALRKDVVVDVNF